MLYTGVQCHNQQSVEVVETITHRSHKTISYTLTFTIKDITRENYV